MKYILFVCKENSARSQMAEALFNFHNKNPEYFAISAGTTPSFSIKPYAIEVMGQKGMVLSKKKPKLLNFDTIKKAYKIFTMGCMDSCPLAPPEKTEGWDLEDPGNEPIEKFREIRDEIEKRIKKLILEL